MAANDEYDEEIFIAVVSQKCICVVSFNAYSLKYCEINRHTWFLGNSMPIEIHLEITFLFVSFQRTNNDQVESARQTTETLKVKCNLFISSMRVFFSLPHFCRTGLCY